MADSGERIDESDAAERERADRLAATMRAIVQQGDLAAAARAARAAIEEFTARGERRGLATAHYWLGKAHQFADNDTEALEAFRSAIALWESLQEPRGLARALDAAAATLKSDGEHTEALRYVRRSLTLAQELDDPELEARALLTASHIYKDLSDHATAIEMLHRSMVLFEAQGNRAGAARAAGSIALNYVILNQTAEAIRFAERSLPALKAAGEFYNLGMVLGILGSAHLKSGQPQAALELFQRSVATMESLGAAVTGAYLRSDISDALVALGRLDEAKEYLEQSLLLNREEEEPLAHCEILSRLGALYARPDFSEHSDARALEVLQSARRIGEERDLPLLLQRVYPVLSELYERTGDLRAALDCARLERRTDKRLFNEESDRRIKLLQVRFDVEQAQKDAEIARRDAEIARRDAEIARLRSVELAEALAEAERLRVQADERARRDALTGLANRRYLDELLNDELKRARRHRRALSVALLDVDHFKRINDTHGHSTGDTILRRIADLLRETSRDEDCIARYGGEEFALLLPETRATEARAFCERLRARVEAEDWKGLVPDIEGVTVSIGLSTLSGSGASGTLRASSYPSPSALLDAADRNLYAAKQGGRNRVVG